MNNNDNDNNDNNNNNNNNNNNLLAFNYFRKMLHRKYLTGF